MMDETQHNPADLGEGFEWAVVEIFGHRQHAGRAREEERFGSKMLRIDDAVTETDGSLTWGATHYYSGSAIFSFTPSNEAMVRRLGVRNMVRAIPFAPREDYDDAADDAGADVEEPGRS